MPMPSLSQRAYSLEKAHAEGMLGAPTSINNEVILAVEWPNFPSQLQTPPLGSPRNWSRLDKSRSAFNRIRAQILPMPDGSIPHSDHWIWTGSLRSNTPYITYNGQLAHPAKILYSLACCSSHLPPGQLQKTCEARLCINPVHYDIRLEVMRAWAPPIWPPKALIRGLAKEDDLTVFFEILNASGTRRPEEGPEMEEVQRNLALYTPHIAASIWEALASREVAEAHRAFLAKEEAQRKREVPGDKTGLLFPDF